MSVQMVRDLRALVTERGPGVYLVTVSAQGGRLRVSPTKAVLHRQGPSPDPTSSCGADCVPLPLLTMPAPR